MFQALITAVQLPDLVCCVLCYKGDATVGFVSRFKVVSDRVIQSLVKQTPLPLPRVFSLSDRDDDDDDAAEDEGALDPTSSFASYMPLECVDCSSTIGPPLTNAFAYVISPSLRSPSLRTPQEEVESELNALLSKTFCGDEPFIDRPIFIVVDDIAQWSIREFRDKGIIQAAIDSWRSTLRDPSLVHPRPFYVSTARDRRVAILCPWTQSENHAISSWVKPGGRFTSLAVCDTCRRYRWQRNDDVRDEWKQRIGAVWKSNGYSGDTGEIFPLVGLESSGELVRTVLNECAKRCANLPPRPRAPPRTRNDDDDFAPLQVTMPMQDISTHNNPSCADRMDSYWWWGVWASVTCWTAIALLG